MYVHKCFFQQIRPCWPSRPVTAKTGVNQLGTVASHLQNDSCFSYVLTCFTSLIEKNVSSEMASCWEDASWRKNNFNHAPLAVPVAVSTFF